MSMKNWAENEIAIACKKENPNWTPNCGDWDYGCACYQSALKAYRSLQEDEHSGFSIQLTKNILNRMIEGLPLTPITEEDFFSVEYGTGEYPAQSKEFLDDAKLKDSRQCPRMSALFRDEDLEGNISYHDVRRTICIDIDNHNDTYTTGIVNKVIDEMFPITMPYYPSTHRYAVYTKGYQSTPEFEESDFDVMAIYYVITPENEKVEINRYFKLVPDGYPITQMVGRQIYNNKTEQFEEAPSEEHTYQPTKWQEIDYSEFVSVKSNEGYFI